MTRRQYSSPLTDDVAPVLRDSEPLWRLLDGAYVLITGGTGFVGCWLLETALWARSRFGIELRIDIVARRPERLTAVAPHLAANPAVGLVRGDIRSGDLPRSAGYVGKPHGTDDRRDGNYTHVIHAATETNVALDNPPPLAAFDASVTGTRHVLDLCDREAVQRFLLISSGAVYGRGHDFGRPLRETDPLAGVRGDLAGAYALGKAAAEFLAMASGTAQGFTAVVARCFSFIGPYQPFDSGFAVANFIRDALAGKPILIKGDGTPMRSYLYGADMALWLWTILLRGQHGEIFNVGSDRPMSIGDLARRIAHEVAAALPVREHPVVVAGAPTGRPPEMFVPDVDLARTRLGLEVLTPLDVAIRRTAHWATCEGVPDHAKSCALRPLPPPNP
ncbi:epimerase [Trinickia symbiotica]|uniref:Epimerase n=1 Tax=Trinickia symbiotica TaxID=863227 RepID=A0A2T3XNI9_9BURK|nr:NAD(P)-dependent oxidoreductase [Trinickia symbiotica]PTB18086.1 epimerase [Trinickia symbiotica]